MPGFAFRTSHISALAASAVGAVTLAGELPAGLRLVLLGVFVLAGPGNAVVDLLPFLDRHLRLLLVPATGVSVALLASTLLVDFGGWSPRYELVGLIGLTVVVAVAAALGPRRDPDRGQHVHPDGGSGPLAAAGLPTNGERR